MAGFSPLSPVSNGATPLTIGGVTFNVKEAPSSIALGAAKQMMAVHNLPGGTRVVHAMGVDPSDVTLSGNLWDSSVQDRVKTLRGYAVDGKERSITWGSESYYCIVRDFTPTYMHDYRATFDITVTITRDANGAFTIPSTTSVDSQVSALQSNVFNLSNQILDADQNYTTSGIPLALTNVQIAVQNAGPLAQLTGSNAQSLVNTVQTALGLVATYQNGLSGSSAWMAQVMQMSSALQLIIDNVNRGQSPQTVQVQGGSLYAIAAKYYGDVTQAFTLASANGLSTPQLSKTVLQTLVIPPLGN